MRQSQELASQDPGYRLYCQILLNICTVAGDSPCAHVHLAGLSLCSISKPRTSPASPPAVAPPGLGWQRPACGSAQGKAGREVCLQGLAALKSPVAIRTEPGLPVSLRKILSEEGILLQLPQSGGAAAGTGGCCHSSLASIRPRIPPRNGTQPRTLCYRLWDACLFLHPPLQVPLSVTSRMLAPSMALEPGCHLTQAPSTGNPCCCRGGCHAHRHCCDKAWPRPWGWEATRGPLGYGLLRWDLSNQLLRLLKMISLPLANELAPGRAPPANTPITAAASIKRGKFLSLLCPLHCSHGNKGGERQRQLTQHGQQRDFTYYIPNEPYQQTTLMHPRGKPQKPNPSIQVHGHNVNGLKPASAVAIGPT